MKTTRRILAVWIALAILMTLAACGSKQEASTAQLVNPVKEVTAEEMVQAVGIPLYAPENAENIRYSTITAGDVVIGQMDFTLGGKAYTYRTTFAQLDAAGLSGIYFTAATESYAKVSYAEGKFLTEGNTSVLFWEDKVPGVCYSLSCTECENPIILLEIAEETFKPLQEADDGVGYAEMPTEYPDMEGTWVDADGSTVELTDAGMHKFDAVIGIFRLAEFTGYGDLDTISMNLTLEAPDGSAVYAEFYIEQDGTGTLIISESEWPLLENKTKFTGFTRKNNDVLDPGEIYEPEYAGVYKRTVREEVGGTEIEKNSYIVLNEDGTGFWIAQDTATLTWDESQLMLTIGANFDIARAEENGTEYLMVYEFQDENGEWMPTPFERIEELPAEAAQMLP